MDTADMNTKCPLFASRVVHWAFSAVLIFLALFLVGETLNVFNTMGHPTAMPANTITVSGAGQATEVPDIARVSFTVQNTAKTVSEAQAATTKQANAALDFVKQQGVADKDIRTLSYNISPQYSYTTCTAGMVCPPSNRTLTGYEVSETVQVTMRDLTKVGALLAGLGKENVQNVSGPNFTLEDTSVGYDAARADAITKAKAQAQILAKQLGVRLGRIVHFSESSNTPYPVYAAETKAVGMGGGSSTPNVPTGENTYTANVSITYEIQ